MSFLTKFFSLEDKSIYKNRYQFIKTNGYYEILYKQERIVGLIFTWAFFFIYLLGMILHVYNLITYGIIDRTMFSNLIFSSSLFLLSSIYLFLYYFTKIKPGSNWIIISLVLFSFSELICLFLNNEIMSGLHFVLIFMIFSLICKPLKYCLLSLPLLLFALIAVIRIGAFKGPTTFVELYKYDYVLIILFLIGGVILGYTVSFSLTLLRQKLLGQCVILNICKNNQHINENERLIDFLTENTLIEFSHKGGKCLLCEKSSL